MKRKNKKVIKYNQKIQAIYLHKNGILNSANVGENGIVSIEIKKGSAVLFMDDGQKLTIDKEEVGGVAFKNKGGDISTFVKNKSGGLVKIRNEEIYEKSNK